MSAHGDVDLGHTLAGWTGTCVVLLGTAAAGAGLALAHGPTLVAGLALVLLAAPVTWALHLAGWGKPAGPRPADQWPWRIRDTRARTGHADCLGCRLAGRAPARRAVAEPADRPAGQPAGRPAGAS
ncbi:HGxxPAAW family protein [Streptomyces sp. BI20]|uniref:HGxxPAAW family protein n=1 Tax=Streptomyces sp. BI20 TaxID=3403460 RepID=UPI003C75FCFD